MPISQAASLAGCSAPTIRYYEAIGLIPNAARTDGGRRSYGWPDVKRLQFIRRARDFGMSIDQIGGVCGRGRNPTLRILASDIRR
ncbi:MAG: MerR family transcriptional regulator [Novosphingobium sp.]|nr:MULTISPECIES: MerR family transcriptional regulator [unclassified Novosphingobium]MBN9142547.1 MerR family transcriptional regulator [Novosphingobium sp.]